MTHELLEQTVREWVFTNSDRGARDLGRLAGRRVSVPQSPADIADALIELAGRLQISETRAW